MVTAYKGKVRQILLYGYIYNTESSLARLTCHQKQWSTIVPRPVTILCLELGVKQHPILCCLLGCTGFGQLRGQHGLHRCMTVHEHTHRIPIVHLGLRVIRK